MLSFSVLYLMLKNLASYFYVVAVLRSYFFLYQYNLQDENPQFRQCVFISEMLPD